MKLKIKKKVLICTSFLCIIYSSIAFASSKSFSVDAGTVHANANVVYSNGKLLDYVDFLGYGASVGGQDASKVTDKTPGTLKVEGNKTGEEINKIFYYQHALNGNKGIGLSNTSVTATVTLQGKSASVTIK